ncbi:MAG: protein-L-isoaspartate(D-aspartate) O-methyltransferase [Planctomycetota bacterium]
MSMSAEQRERMVLQHLVGRGVHDVRVLEAMRAVPREAFVPETMRDRAYEDRPLPIEEGQTISQPYVVAVMAEALEIGPDDRVLEVGAGSGYAAAVLGRLAREVFAIEWYESLATSAAHRMRSLGIQNVHVVHGDGTQGLADQAPFDAILVSAAGPEVPETLLQQLAVGGRLVIPVGVTPYDQELLVIRRTGEQSFERRSLGSVAFVPLLGAEG